MGETNTTAPSGTAAADKTYSAFFYGTLMAPEVFFTVCFRMSNPPDAVRAAYAFRPAILHDYCRRRVKFADYPGVVAQAGQTVRGMYVTGLTSANMGKLDEFEGSEYDRLPVRVRLLDRVGDDRSGEGNVEGAELEAETYVFKEPDKLEDKEWDFDHFRNERMKLWTRKDYNFAD